MCIRDREEQRAEIRESRIAHQQTADELGKQTFENTFFQMLSLHHQIVDAVDVAGGYKETLTGRDCFSAFASRVRRQINADIQGNKDKKTDFEIATQSYEEYYNQIQDDIGHYFRNLYNTVKFVDLSSVEDKQFYTNLIRAQLSASELSLLFYNCISMHGSQKFRPLIEKYSLLKNMPLARLIKPEHKDWLAASAYGNKSNAT